ncbi:MAG: hypothetical protein DA407_05680 [Bacteroidetes bacterium]|nr:MAG: hypothetical protein DA407_05680 [Bacteroidota bacterium]
MEEFLNNYYSIINSVVVFFPAIVGVFVLKKYSTTSIKYFIWFCFYVAFVELIGAYNFYFDKFESLSFMKEFLKDTIFETVQWWYLILWTLGSTLFYALYFKNIIKGNSFKKVIKFATLFFLIIFFTSVIYYYDAIVNKPPSIIGISGSILIFICVLLYLVEILKSDKVLSIFNSVNFYIASTILLWNLIMIPLTFYDVYFNSSDMDFSILKALIYLGCNTFMYLTFSFALLWCKPQNN